MGYPDHFLLNFGGNRGTSTGEIWSCGIRMWADDYTTLDEEEYLNGVAKDAIAAWFVRPNSKIMNNADLRWAKFNNIGPDGEYTSELTNEYIWPTPVAGVNSGASNVIFQATVALSWRTNAKDRGIASHGRIFSPAPAVTTSSGGGLFPAADALLMAQSAALFLNTLDVTVGTSPMRPAIVSRGKRSGPADDPVYGTGEANQIDWVFVDNRIDIQRRRANQLVAATSTAEVLY